MPQPGGQAVSRESLWVQVSASDWVSLSYSLLGVLNNYFFPGGFPEVTLRIKGLNVMFSPGWRASGLPSKQWRLKLGGFVGEI